MKANRLTAWKLCCVWGLILLLLSSSSGTAAQIPTRLEKAYQEYLEKRQEFASQLRALQASAESLGDLPLVRAIKHELSVIQGEKPLSLKLLRSIKPEISFSLAPAERELHVKFRKTCEDTARDFYLLARRVQGDSPTFAFELLNLVLQIDSDHATARTMRGYVRQGNEWMTPFEREQRNAGRVEHPLYGWLPSSHIEKYEAGERYFLGNWVTAAKEAEIRRDFRHAWVVQTEHFQIKTNVSLEHGVAVGRKLELFHDYFKQTFALFYNSPEQLRKLFDGTSGKTKNQSQLYTVHVFRTKDEYVSHLIKRIPQIALTNGLYQLEDRISYFYHDPSVNLDPTLFHEATHQLMYESHLRQRDVGRNAHFWIIEGIACYMESFRPEETEEGLRYDLGDPRFVRFYWARHRLLEENYQLPLAGFSQLGMIEFQSAPAEELQRRYSQASGLSHFLMHYDKGKYRDALMLHLAQLYHSNPRVQLATQGLDQLTGVPYSTLDRQYREYLQTQQEAMADQEVIQ